MSNMRKRKIDPHKHPFIVGMLMRAVIDAESAKELLRTQHFSLEERRYLRETIEQGERAKRILEEKFGINVEEYLKKRRGQLKSHS